MHDERGFQFDDAHAIMGVSSLCVCVPAGILSKRQLLEVIDSQIGFPEYFGRNWDAFEECIRDLSWLESLQIILIHADIPLESTRKEAWIYLSILRDAVAYWESRSEHQLVIVFPKKCKDQVRELISIHEARY